MSKRTTLKAVLAALVALTVVLASGSAAVGQSSDNARPEPLLSNEPLSGGLLGNRAGVFHYYAVDYPGDLRVVTIELYLAPGDPVAVLGAGFNVYAPDGYLLGQGQPKLGAEAGSLHFDYSDRHPATWLIQVFNYLPDQFVEYSIIARGFRQEIQPYITALDQPIINGRVTVTRVVSNGPGWVSIHADKDGQPGPVIGQIAVPSGASSHVVVAVDAARATPTLYAVVQPYAEVEEALQAAEAGVAVARFMVGGGAAPVVGGEHWLARGMSLSGSLMGQAHGAFAYYSFIYPGDRSDWTVRMEFRPDTPAVGHDLGMIFYGPSGEIGRGEGTSIPGERIIQFSSNDYGMYVIQVYNYIHNIAMYYAVSVK